MTPRVLHGLRARMVAALVLTSAISLGVAAVLLLSPLERRLRADRLDALTAAAVSNQSSFERLSAAQLRTRGLRLVRALGRRTGAEVTLLDTRGVVLAASNPDEVVDRGTVARALREQRVVRVAANAAEGPEARVAVPLRGQSSGALLIAAQLEETQTAASVVRSALLGAMAVALAVALIVGLALATRLVRRLRRLRDTALRVSDIGPVVEIHTDSARDEVGDLTRAFAHMQDQLMRQERARRTFVSTASHELRTPLASLQLMLGMLREDLAADRPDLAAASDDVGRAEAQIERLSRLASDLLDLSRIDAGVPLRGETVEVGEICHAIAREFGALLTDRPGPIVVVAPEPARAHADPVAVARIVRILVDNALKFSPDSEPVEVAVAQGAGGVSVTVSDAGPGVPTGEREAIFDRFTRGSEAAASGFGLGLAIARELARGMNGELRFEEVQRGARFILSLPAAGS